MLGAAPFGAIFGALAVTGGLSPGAALGMSLFVYAGSSQFIAAGLIAESVSLGLIVLTTFVVNLRHALYGASLGPHLKHLPQTWQLPLAFTLTDETFAVTILRFTERGSRPDGHWYMLGSAAAMYINWQVWTAVGIIAGQQFEDAASLGLDFAMVVTFIGIVVPLIATRPMLISALVAGSSAVLLNDLPNRTGLLVAALLGIAAGAAAEALWPGEDAAADE
ncbi:MAG: AzlC family ABC transporter permease [Chloroflexi bacterium]|nr:AzlC family ABC transporter permease [Chloroflexota bacterium]